MFAFLFAAALQPPAAPSPREADPFRRWEPAVQAIEKRLAARPPKPGGVVFAGSSSIVRWDVKAAFPELDAVNVGFGGSVVRDSIHFADRFITPLKPRAVVFYAGDNDIGGGRTPRQVADDFRAFCAAVHKEVPACRILFIAVKPSLARWKQFDVQQKANALVKELCAADDRLTFVDVVPLMLGPDGKPVPELFVKDGLHMSPAGYERWNAAVRKALGK